MGGLPWRFKSSSEHHLKSSPYGSFFVILLQLLSTSLSLPYVGKISFKDILKNLYFTFLLPIGKYTIINFSLPVSSVGLLHLVSFTALIGFAYRSPVCLSLVVKPAFRVFLSLNTSQTKKAILSDGFLLLVSSVGFEPATL